MANPFARDADTIKADCEAARLRRASARTAHDRKQADAARALREADGYQRDYDRATASIDGLLAELSAARAEQVVQAFVAEMDGDVLTR